MPSRRTRRRSRPRGRPWMPPACTAAGCASSNGRSTSCPTRTTSPISWFPKRRCCPDNGPATRRNWCGWSSRWAARSWWGSPMPRPAGIPALSVETAQGWLAQPALAGGQLIQEGGIWTKFVARPAGRRRQLDAPVRQPGQHRLRRRPDRQAAVGPALVRQPRSRRHGQPPRPGGQPRWPSTAGCSSKAKTWSWPTTSTTACVCGGASCPEPIGPTRPTTAAIWPSAARACWSPSRTAACC